MSDTFADQLTDAFFVAFEARRYFAALEAAQCMRQASPKDPFWQRMYAVALSKVDRFSEAETILLAAAGEQPNDAKLALIVGRLYDDWGKFDAAEKWYRKACELNPTQTHPWILLGVTQTRLERLADADATLRHATTLQGDIDEAYVNLGNVRQLMGDSTGARKCFEAALTMSDDYESAKLRIADLNDAERIRAKFGGERAQSQPDNR